MITGRQNIKINLCIVVLVFKFSELKKNRNTKREKKTNLVIKIKSSEDHLI